MSEAGEKICSSEELSERGKGVRFDVRDEYGTVCAFVLRIDGKVHGYLNRCAHVSMEMDWQPGEFLDSSQRWILCATHGAAYEPDTGRCIAGPCNGASLTRLDVREENGIIHWYPDARFESVF